MTALARHIAPRLKRLAPPSSRVIVASSGGPDSQTLLDVMAELRHELGLAALWAVGVNHGLRAEAAAELDQAEALARARGVHFERVDVQVSSKGNILAKARVARYRALCECADRLGADRIAIAHTATDQVETVLFNLARGSGLRGLGGIRPRRGRIIRPLLSISRQAIVAHLTQRGIAYAQDPSNLDPRRARAQLRSDVLPALRRLNRRLEANVCHMTILARAHERYLTRLGVKRLEELRGVLDSLRTPELTREAAPLSARVIQLWLAKHNVPSSRQALTQVVRALRTGCQRAELSVHGRQLCLEQGHLWMLDATSYEHALSPPGGVRLPALSVVLRGRVEPKTPDVHGPLDIAKPDALSVAFDADRLHLELRVRSWQHGDRFRPFGLGGHMKVGDLFTDHKIPRALRQRWPIVACARSGEILWVVGLRRGAAAPLSNTTRRALILELDGAPIWRP